MSLERGRNIAQGVMILAFVAIALWVSKPAGLILVAFMGVMKLQESVTDWCPSDLFLRPLGCKKRTETKS